MHEHSFFEKGWFKFDQDPKLKSWVEHSLPIVRKTVLKKQHQQWLRCGGTWFAGVNVLQNDACGRVEQGPCLEGRAVRFINNELGISSLNLDPGQISICYPGYPKPMPSETDAAFNYRLKRDAAHVDGLLPEGEKRRRHLREHHGFILGIPMIECSPDASPVVVWEGSHERIRSAFRTHFLEIPPQSWGNVDVTSLYQAARRAIFKHCKRVEIFAKPGEAYIIHRLALHGVAPWGENAWSGDDGRMICYFRPEIAGPWEWLNNR